MRLGGQELNSDYGSVAILPRVESWQLVCAGQSFRTIRCAASFLHDVLAIDFEVLHIT